jgi:hypothetical protein
MKYQSRDTRFREKVKSKRYCSHRKYSVEESSGLRNETSLHFHS